MIASQTTWLIVSGLLKSSCGMPFLVSAAEAMEEISNTPDAENIPSGRISASSLIR